MITGGQMDGIRKRIRALDAAVAAKAEEIINRTSGKGNDALRDALFTELQPVCAEAFELASQLAQAVYNGWRLIELGEAIETASAAVFDQEKFDNMAYTAVASKGKAADVIGSYVGFNIRDAYAQTLFACARSDKRKPRFARVPQGTETCRFCLMLASRGFVYSSGKSGKKVHNHANCDCIYVASWDKNPKAAGYDPDYYYDVYKHPDQHPEIRDALNARRRELYAEKRAVGATRNKAYIERDNRVANGPLIVTNSQEKHIEGTIEWQKDRQRARDLGKYPRSYFSLSEREVQELIMLHAGKGEPIIDGNYHWTRKERCISSKVIGYRVNPATGDEEETRYFIIHYSNDGVHAMPGKDGGDKPDDV